MCNHTPRYSSAQATSSAQARTAHIWAAPQPWRRAAPLRWAQRRRRPSVPRRRTRARPAPSPRTWQPPHLQMATPAPAPPLLVHCHPHPVLAPNCMPPAAHACAFLENCTARPFLLLRPSCILLKLSTASAGQSDNAVTDTA
jgi:hypothetical protein